VANACHANTAAHLEQGRLCTAASDMLIAKNRELKTRAAGLINHNYVFFSSVDEPLETTYLPYNRWTEVLHALPVRFRKPYDARHSNAKARANDSTESISYLPSEVTRFLQSPRAPIAGTKAGTRKATRVQFA
jgi:hypothetical protein